MKYRTLGSTGLKVSVVGIGTWQLGGGWGKQFEQDEVDAMFDKCRETGINLIDTAECYGPDHRSESLIGPAIERDRDQWVIATKFGHDKGPAWQPDQVEKQVHDSLKALRTDHVELLQFHSGGDDVFDTPGLWERCNQLKEQGKVRHLGVSIGSNENTYQTGKCPEIGAEAIQVVYNRLNRNPEKAVFDLCRKHELGVLARVPLASGFLSGKYRPEDAEKFEPGDVRHKRDVEGMRKTIEEVQRIQREEVPAGVPMAQWALAWCLKHPAVTCVIPGCKSVEQVESNAAAADLEMVADDHPQAV